MMASGRGLNLGLGCGGWVPTLRHGTLDVWLRDCQGVAGVKNTGQIVVQCSGRISQV